MWKKKSVQKWDEDCELEGERASDGNEQKGGQWEWEGKSMGGVKEVSMRRGEGSEHEVGVIEVSMRRGEGSEHEGGVMEVSMRWGEDEVL